MSLADDAIGNLHIKNDAAFEFFVVYARYEYAAKVARYVYKPPLQGKKLPELKINLQDVADNIKDKFHIAIQNDRALSDAVAYYQQFPPKGQVWNGAGPDWADIEYNDTFPCILLRRLAQARNNLFHGGKGWKGDQQTWDRDNLLISHGLIILEAVIKSDEALSGDFTSYQ
ncbi:hypothetical protein [Mesorhizobium sp. M0037]|uniref:hypothetical protein n=1 Tax=unclassified Mesorhizobium TaxID=325217 RepID=UPI00333A19F4